MSAAAPHLPSLFPTWGITFIGATFSTILFGVVCLQTFLYYRQWQRDVLALKILVAVVFALDTINQVVVTYMLYHYFVENFAHPAALAQNHWSIGAEIISNALVGFLVEGFFVYRVWRVSGSKVLLPLAASILAIAHLGTNLVSAVLGFKYNNFHDLLKALKPMAIGGSILGACEDLAIALILAYCLYQGRSGFRTTNSMITRLIAVAVATGLITSLALIAQSISSIVAPESLWILAWNLLLPKLYTNSLLASLNLRNVIRSGTSNTTRSNNVQTSTALEVLDRTGAHGGNRTQVHVQMSTIEEFDKDLDHMEPARKYPTAV